jgi:hypothetical protein
MVAGLLEGGGGCGGRGGDAHRAVRGTVQALAHASLAADDRKVLALENSISADQYLLRFFGVISQ